jgi:hypothetical protein
MGNIIGKVVAANHDDPFQHFNKGDLLLVVGTGMIKDHNVRVSNISRRLNFSQDTVIDAFEFVDTELSVSQAIEQILQKQTKEM